VNLPSNNKFGFFFTFVFLLVGGHFLITNSINLSYIFFGLSLIFLSITFVKADILLPLNKLWMRFGILLGMIVSPLVLGLIFFALITPYGLVMRLFGRDELRLKLNKDKSHWKERIQTERQTDFKQQF